LPIGLILKLCGVIATALGLVVIAETSTVDAAAIAALASVGNTWLILRHDRKVTRLQETIAQLEHQATAHRTATRAGDRDVVVIDPHEIDAAAREVSG
jgi:hypothetical protein